MSQAWISPKDFAVLSTAKPISGMSTPVHHCPATYCCTLPSMNPQWLSLEGMYRRPVLGSYAAFGQSLPLQSSSLNDRNTEQGDHAGCHVGRSMRRMVCANRR